MKTHPYDDTQFNPPAAIANVTLENEATGESLSNVVMQLDTGADITLIPKHAVIQLEVDADEQHQVSLTNFDGIKSTSQSFQVTVTIDRYTFRGSFPIIDQEMGIIGRDILNLLPILFDGPNREWKVSR